MAKYIYTSSNEALTELLNEKYDMVCNEHMETIITGEREEIEAYVEEVAPAATEDYTLEDIE